MKKISKLGLVSAILINVWGSTGAFAHNSKSVIDEEFVKLSAGTISADGSVTYPCDTDFNHIKNMASHEKARLEQETYEKSWTKLSIDAGKSAALFIGNKLVENADYYGRLALAWNLNYYGIEAIEELTANIAYASATLVTGNSVVGTAAYAAAKAGIKAARWIIPGFEGGISGVYAPLTKAVIVDPVINYGPTVVKSTAKGIFNVGKFAASQAKSWYSWATTAS